VGACECSNKPRVPCSAGDYLTSFGSVIFSERALFHVVCELDEWMDGWMDGWVGG
jgi:hypothetical protein